MCELASWTRLTAKAHVLQCGMHSLGLGHHSGYRYNEGMRNYFEAGHCGQAHVVDVFNMTHALVRSYD